MRSSPFFLGGQMLDTKINSLLGIKYPIIQGGMAWISDAELAAAVSNAGGLGVIAAGNAPSDWLKKEIDKVRSLTDKPFGVNVMLLSPFAEDICNLVAEEKVPVVITGAGNPGKYISLWKENNIKVLPVVPSVALAIRLQRLDVDGLICEGTEAGGHIGELTTMSLLPQIVDIANVPVVAAGGIGDGRGVAASFSLGADGIQVGTRFLVATECNVHQNYKDKILSSKDTDTTVTGRKTGHPVRVLKNKLARKFKDLDKINAPVEQYEELGKSTLYKAAVEGDMKLGSVMSGQIAGLINKEQSCKEIIEEMFDEAEKTINGLNKLFTFKNNM